MNNKELAFYEKIGVRKFKNIIVTISEKLLGEFKSSAFNYFPKGYSKKELNDFKKSVIFNSSVHVIANILTIVALVYSIKYALVSKIIYDSFFVLLNSYCIMLQRYNWIRINETVKKIEKHDNMKIGKYVNEIEKIDSSLSKHKYITYNKEEKKEVDIDSVLENTTIEQLKYFKEYLLKMDKIDELMKSLYIDYDVVCDIPVYNEKVKIKFLGRESIRKQKEENK